MVLGHGSMLEDVWLEGEETGRGQVRSLLGSAAVHLVVGCLVLLASAGRPLVQRDSPPFFGFLGPARRASDLDVPNPNSLRFHFYQAPRRGVAVAVQGVGDRASLRTIPPSSASADASRKASRPASAGLGAPLRRPDSGASGQGRVTRAADADDPALPAGLPALEPELALSEDVVILKLIKPLYPERELEQRISARVIVALHVNVDGEIDELVVKEAQATPAAPTRAFEITSLDALRQWRVRLPRRYAEAGCWLTVPVEFSPDDKDFGRLGNVSVP
jgi:TonB family protein